jgi:hypothetical protein
VHFLSEDLSLVNHYYLRFSKLYIWLFASNGYYRVLLSWRVIEDAVLNGSAFAYVGSDIANYTLRECWASKL